MTDSLWAEQRRRTVTDKDMEHLMWLARVKLEPHEVEKMRKEIERVMEFIDKLLEARVESVEPLYHAVEKQGLLRDDEASRSLSQAEALANAAASEEGYIKAPRPLEE